MTYRVALLSLCLCASVSKSATLKVGPTEAYQTPCQAIYAAAAGDTIEIAPGTYAGADAVCLITKPLVIRPSGAGRVILNARDQRNFAWNVYSRGIWALELPVDTTLDVSGIDFVGAAVSNADGHNGAGIRMTKGGNLKVTNCGFYYGQNGILTSSGTGKVEVIDSVFAYNGTGGGYEHNLYIQGAELVFTHSTSRNSWTGQGIKCRTPKCRVEYSLLGDQKSATNGNTNVEVEMPNGGVAIVRGNLIAQSSQTTNAYVVSMGQEGANAAWTHSSTITNNTLVGYRNPNNFFRHVSDSKNNPAYPGPVVIEKNVVAGEPGASYFTGKQPTSDVANWKSKPLTIFVSESNGDYHLKAPIPPEYAESGAYPVTALAMTPPGVETIPVTAPGVAAGFDKLAMPPPAPDEKPIPPTPATGQELVGVISALPATTVGVVIRNADGTYSVILTAK